MIYCTTAQAKYVESLIWDCGDYGRETWRELAKFSFYSGDVTEMTKKQASDIIEELKAYKAEHVKVLSATTKQISYIESLLKKLGEKGEELLEKVCGQPVADLGRLDREIASRLINTLKAA